MADLLAAATSSFTPTPASETGEGFPSPFALEPRGGYRTWLSTIDPDGMWAPMFAPGAAGFGLFVSAWNPFLCCYGQDMHMAPDDDDGIPLLFPAAVQWNSVIEPANDRLVPQVLHDWNEDLSFPPVGITSDWWLDDGNLMPWVNLIHQEEAEWQETWQYVGDLNVVLTGLAAPWQIVPITDEAFVLLKDWLPMRSQLLGAHVLGITNCEMQQGDDDYLAPDHSEGREPNLCAFELGRLDCACGEAPTAWQQWDALVEPLVAGVFTTEDLFLPPQLYPLWRLAQRNFALGWLASAARAAQGDAWSSFCWRRLSPFSGSHSLASLLQRLSQPSTSSATLPASSPESSQQLTLSGL